MSWVDKPSGFACGNLNSCNLTDIGIRAHSSLTGIGASDHHVKFSDQNAVDACDASNKFIERNVVNLITETTLKRTSGGTFLKFHGEIAGMVLAGTLMKTVMESTTKTYNQIMANIVFPALVVKDKDGVEKEIGSMKYFKAWNQNSSFISYSVRDIAGNAKIPLEIYSDKIDVKNLPIKDIKNHVHSALSGTKKLIEILIGTTSYYWEVYPTKA